MLRVAAITAPVGIRGEMRIEWWTDVPANLEPGRTVHTDARGTFVVEALRSAARPRVKLAGIDTREAAEAMRGTMLWVPLAAAAPLPPGQYYVPQVMGSTVVTADGARLGQVSEVIHTGSNDVYVVRGPDGETLIPAIADVVEHFDVEAGEMRVRLPPGLS